jgi:hypothetical protein
MPITILKNMKKRMERVLQESAKLGHANNLEWLDQPKIDLEEAKTFHVGEQNKLKDITESIELRIVRPMENHPPKLRHIKTKLEI